MHSVLPVPVAYLPAAQAVHAALPADAYFPASQVRHSELRRLPVLLWYLPATHGVQDRAPVCAEA